MVKIVNNGERRGMTYTIELDGQPPKEHVVLSKDLCKRLLVVIKDVDRDLYYEFSNEFKRSVRDNWGIPKAIREKIPPYLSESDVCFKKDIYAVMKSRSSKKEKLVGYLKGLPQSEVISLNPIIITKLGLELLKKRIW